MDQNVQSKVHKTKGKWGVFYQNQVKRSGPHQEWVNSSTVKLQAQTLPWSQLHYHHCADNVSSQSLWASWSSCKLLL